MNDLIREAFHFPFVHTREFCELAIRTCFGFALSIVCYASVGCAKGTPVLELVFGLCAICDFVSALVAGITLLEGSFSRCHCGLRLDNSEFLQNSAVSMFARVAGFVAMLLVFGTLELAGWHSRFTDGLLISGLGWFFVGVPFVLFLCTGRALQFEEFVQSRCKVVETESDGEGETLYFSLLFQSAVVFLFYFSFRTLLTASGYLSLVR